MNLRRYTTRAKNDLDDDGDFAADPEGKESVASASASTSDTNTTGVDTNLDAHAALDAMDAANATGVDVDSPECDVEVGPCRFKPVQACVESASFSA